MTRLIGRLGCLGYVGHVGHLGHVAVFAQDGQWKSGSGHLGFATWLLDEMSTWPHGQLRFTQARARDL
jgi:hypothetical protein